MNDTWKTILSAVIFLAIFFVCHETFAATYWVAHNGAAAWSNCKSDSPLSGASACALATANANAVAGDTVYLRGGTYIIKGYESGIAPVNSGTSPGSMITFSAYGGETPLIYGKDYAASPSNPATEEDLGGFSTVCINLRGSYISGDWGGRDFIKVSGISCRNTVQFLLLNHSDYIEVSYCTFGPVRDPWKDVYVWGTAKNDVSHYNQSANVLYDPDHDFTTSCKKASCANRRLYNVTDRSNIYSLAAATSATAEGNNYRVLVGGAKNYFSYGDVYQITYGPAYDPAPVSLRGGSTHNWIHHNTVHGTGFFQPDQDGTPVFSVGPDSLANPEYNNHNTIEYNHVYHGGHHVFSVNQGLYNVIRHNYFHNESWFDDSAHSGNCAAQGLCGYRIVSNTSEHPEASGRGLWEDNRIGWGAAYGGPHLLTGGSGSGTTMDTPNNIYRYNDHFGNALFGMRLGSSMERSSMGNKIYNNTFYHNGYGADDDPYALDAYRSGFYFYNTDVTGCSVVNNLFYDHWAQSNKRLNSVYYPAIGFAGSRDALLAHNDVRHNYVNTSTNYSSSSSPIPEMSDPLFVNGNVPAQDADHASVVVPFLLAWPNVLPNLSLQSGSPAANGGTHLTTARASGSNTTTLGVVDASYFQDGTWGSNLSRGTSGHFYTDWIAIGTVNTIRRIASVNYETNTITLATPATWANNAPVWLYKKSDGAQVLSGTAPDYGAHEYIEAAGPSETAPPAAPAGLTVN